MPNYWTVQDYVPAIRGGGNQFLAAQNTAIHAKDLEARRQEAQRQLELQRAQEARMEREYLIRKSAEDRIVKAQADELKLKQGAGLGYQGAEIDPRMMEDDVFRTGWIGGRAARVKDEEAERARLEAAQARMRPPPSLTELTHPRTGEPVGLGYGNNVRWDNSDRPIVGWKREGDPLFGGETRTPTFWNPRTGKPLFEVGPATGAPPPPASTNAIPTSSGTAVPKYRYDPVTKKTVQVK
jgi:hypothetical protein